MKLRIGLIGLGAWGATVLKALSTRDDVELVWTASRNDWPTKLDAQKSRTDAVAICVPPTAQAMIARECLEDGISVFLEKPFALDTPSARRIHDTAAMRGLPVVVDHTRIFDPRFTELLRRSRGAGFGYLESWSGGAGPVRDWGVPHAGLWDWAPHDVAMILELLDGELPTRVAGKQETPGLYHMHLYFPNRVADQGRAFVSTGNGLLGRRPRVLRGNNGGKEPWTLSDTELIYDGKPVHLTDIRRPLDVALDCWLRAVRGEEWDPRVGTSLAMKVVQVIEDAADTLENG